MKRSWTTKTASMSSAAEVRGRNETPRRRSDNEDPRGNRTAAKIHFLELCQQPIELAQRFASLHPLSFLFC